MSLEPGQIIDNKYRIVRLIGEGGMGSVFEGENTLIARRVAIKVLHRQASENEAAMTRFEREAQAAGHIGSDHILEVLDLGMLPGGDRYMVMEFLDGEALSDRIRKMGKLTPEQLVPLLRQAIVGLKAAHHAGIIHRDLKPDNIFIVNNKAGRVDFVKIIDFGISKFNALGGDMAMTRTGAVMGTPYYMSPEQAKGSRNIDPRSDLYSMGVICYEALTGQVPFDGDTFNELMFKIVLSQPPRLSEAVAGIDPTFVALVEKMMAREADLRFQTAEELIAALDAYAAGADISAATMMSVGEAPRAAMASTTGEAPPTVGTGNTWATSQADGIPKKSSAPVVVAALVGVLVLGGGALAAASLLGGSETKTPELAASAEPSVIASAAARLPAEVTPEPTPEPTVAPEAAPSASAAPSAAVPQEQAAATPKAVRRATKPKPRSVPKPTPKPAPRTTETTPKPKTKKGEREFGY